MLEKVSSLSAALLLSSEVITGLVPVPVPVPLPDTATREGAGAVPGLTDREAFQLCNLALDPPISSPFSPSTEQSLSRRWSYRNIELSSANWDPRSAASSYLTRGRIVQSVHVE